MTSKVHIYLKNPWNPKLDMAMFHGFTKYIGTTSVWISMVGHLRFQVQYLAQGSMDPLPSESKIRRIPSNSEVLKDTPSFLSEASGSAVDL